MEVVETSASTTFPADSTAETAKDMAPATRIAQLEAEIQSMVAAHDKEKEDFLENIKKKTQLLDVQRIKLNRYELAIKEASLFLGRPLLSYEEWLNGKEDADPLSSFSIAVSEANQAMAAPQQPNYSYSGQPQSSGASLGVPPQRSRHLSMTPTSSSAATVAASFLQQPASNKSNTVASSTSNIPALLAERQQAQKNMATDLIPPQALPASATALESQCLECMRLALNFLLSAQRSVRLIDDGTYFTSQAAVPAKLTLTENESLALLAPIGSDSPIIQRADSILSPRRQITSQRVDGLAGSPRLSPLRASGGLGSNGNDASFASSSREGEKRPPSASSHRDGTAAKNSYTMSTVNHHEDDENDDGDLSTNMVESEHRQQSLKSTIKGKCDSCRELMIQIDHLNDHIKDLEKNAVRLEKERANEASARKRIQRSKEIMDQELEELTSQLFEQANHLVADHARQHDEIEKAHRALNTKYLSTLRKLQAAEDEMKGMRKILYDMQVTQMQSSTFTMIDNRDHAQRIGSVHGRSSSATTADPNQAAQFGKALTSQPKSGAPIDQDKNSISYSHTIVSGYDTFEVSVAVDGVIFQEFQEHIKTMALASTQPPAQALATTFSTVFMKRCISEDVEPCLLYSYQLPITGISKNVYGAGLSLSFKKRLVECAMRSQCEIKLIASLPSTRSLLTSNQSSTSIDSTQKTASSQQNQPSTPGSSPQAVPKDRCTLCTITRDCEYAIRLFPVQSGSKEWTALCRFCRDRITSVLDFFTYAGYMRQGTIGPGKQGATILSIFRQMLWLRRRMAVARIGSCAVFETNLSALTGPGGGGEWETDIKILP